MRRRQRLSLTGSLEGSERQSLEDPDRGAQADRLFALDGGAEAARRAVTRSTVRGSSPRSQEAARRDRRALLCPQPRSWRHATKAARARECAQAIPAPRRRPQSSLLMRQLIGAGTPREAVAGGYGGIFVLLTPTGAMLVARGGLAKRPDGFRRHSSSGSESRKKPLNQRAVRPRHTSKRLNRWRLVSWCYAPRPVARPTGPPGPRRSYCQKLVTQVSGGAFG